MSGIEVEGKDQELEIKQHEPWKDEDSLPEGINRNDLAPQSPGRDDPQHRVDDKSRSDEQGASQKMPLPLLPGVKMEYAKTEKDREDRSQLLGEERAQLEKKAEHQGNGSDPAGHSPEVNQETKKHEQSGKNVHSPGDGGYVLGVAGEHSKEPGGKNGQPPSPKAQKKKIKADHAPQMEEHVAQVKPERSPVPKPSVNGER